MPQLSQYHIRSESDGLGARGDDLSFTTDKSPRAWERSVKMRERYLRKTKDVVSRPDLDAVAEYYALQKVKKEQEERRALYERLAQHREAELRKMEEKRARRLCLQVKAGQLHPQALMDTVGSDLMFGTAEEIEQGSAPSLEEVLACRWQGSWTSHSQYAGSLTHKPTRAPGRMLHDPHRYRMDH